MITIFSFYKYVQEVVLNCRWSNIVLNVHIIFIGVKNKQ